MLNKDLVDVLQQVNKITNSVILKYPTTVAISESQDMMVSVDVAALDGDAFTDIGLKNSLGDFLNLVKLFPDDRTVQISEHDVTIQSGDMTSLYITDNVKLMDTENLDSSHFERTESVPSVAEFTLTVDDIKKIKSSSGVFKDLTEIIIKSQDGDLSISLGAVNRFNAKSNTFSVNKTGTTDKDFSIRIPVENFKMLPESDYAAHIKYNSGNDSYRILLLNQSLPGFKLFLTVKV